jgi:enolase
MTTTIEKMSGREILDSRGIPTLEVAVECTSGVVGVASVPSGTSTGKYEAREWRDHDPKRYNGMGVLGALAHVNDSLNELLHGQDVCAQQEIDEQMIAADGSPHKSNLGANAILGVSLACARAGAAAQRQPLYHYLQELFGWPKGFQAPIPLVNMINGGKHADTNLPWQEFWVVPHGAKTYRERVQVAATIFHTVGQLLEQRGWDRDVGLEGGYAPDVSSTTDVWKLIHRAIEQSGYTLGVDCTLGMDAAASELYDSVSHRYRDPLAQEEYTIQDLIRLFQCWGKDFGITYLEDGCDQDAWDDWKQLTKELANTMTVIGDDVFATNPARLKQGIATGVANGVIIKPNQIGTLTETMRTIRMAKEAKYAVALSHRSGETNDAFVADLAVAVAAEYVKVGSVSRGERVAKHNRLMEIEEESRS